MATMQQRPSFTFQLEQSHPVNIPGGTMHRAIKDNFPALQGFAIQSLHLQANAMREPHVHPNAAQLDYCLSGKARIGILGPNKQFQTFELEAGEISFVPQGYVHWIENIGQGPLHFLLILSHEDPETIEVPEMLAVIPQHP